MSDYEKQLLHQVQRHFYLVDDSLRRAASDFNEDGVNKDSLGYAWIQLQRALVNMKKLKSYVVALRTRALDRLSEEGKQSEEDQQ
jgi:hypothetical protein